MLTNKQQLFVDEYLIDLNATQAAIRAGYSEKTVAVIGANKYYVYFLISPITNKIFYVGKGKGNRAYQHEKDANKNIINNGLKHAEIVSIHNKNKNVLVYIFDYFDSEDKAFLCESILIKEFRNYGITNIVNGCYTSKQSVIEKAKHYISILKNYDEWIASLSNDKKHFCINTYGSCENYYLSFKQSLIELSKL